MHLATNVMIVFFLKKVKLLFFSSTIYMYFNAPRLQQRVSIKKKILVGACPLATSRLRRSVGKFQFLVPKLNPMPAV